MMAEKPRRKFKWLRRIAITAVALVLFYTVFGFWGVPLLIRYVGLAKVNDSIAGHGEIEAIYFNPYTYQLRVEGMQGFTPDGEVALGMRELRVNFAFTSLFGDNLRFQEVYFGEPMFNLVVDPDGNVNIQSALEQLQAQVEDQVHQNEESGEPFEIPVIEVEILQVEKATLSARLENLSDPFERKVENLSFVMKDIRTSPDRDNPYHFTLDTTSGEEIKIDGSIKLDPLSSDGSISIDRIKLADFYKFTNDELGFTVAGGELSFSADYAFRPVREPRELFIQNGRVLLEGFELRPRGSDEPFQTLERFEMDGIAVYLFRGAVAVDKIDIVNGMLKVVRDKAGVLSLVRYVTPKERQAELEQMVAAEQQADKAAREFIFGLIADQQDIGLAFTSAWQQLQEMVEVSWDLKVGQLNVENQNLILIDEVPADPVKVTLGEINLAVTDMANQSETPFPFDLALNVNETGKVTARGTFTSVPPSVDFEYNVENIDLTAFSPYVAASSPARLNRAVLANKGKLKASFPDQALPTVEASYTVTLTDFDTTVGPPLYTAEAPLHVAAQRLVHSGRTQASFPADDLPDMTSLGDALVAGFALGRGADTEPLVSWDKLTITAIDTATHPMKAQVDTVTLEGLTTHVVRAPGGELNLLTELIPQMPDSATPPAADATSAAGDKPVPAGPSAGNQSQAAGDTAPDGPGPAFDVDPANIGLKRFVLKNGTVSVLDQTVTPNAAFTLKQMAATVGPLSLAPGATTDIDSSLTLEKDGSGTINVTGTTLLVDPLSQSTVQVNISDLPMTGFSGYAVQAVGSPLTGGTFNGDFSYGVSTDELKGDNKLKIKKVRFGQRVPESKAPNLPLDLGIAVMENRDGFIDLDVPVSGNLEDPQFTISKVVSTALSNIFEKVVTAPFALLGSAFGSGGEAPPSEVTFVAGSSNLPDAAREPLTLLAKALYDRPALALNLVPSVDMKKDVEFFREDLVEDSIEELRTQEGKDWNDAVEALFDKAFPEGLPANPDGTEVTLTPGVMKAKLVEVQEVPDTLLQLLAHQRAEEVKTFILASQELDAGRVAEEAPEGGFAQDGSKVSFKLGVAKSK
ncbi:DUF748 domain-containing protein [Ruficoccus amylovorans]|uniref:DUF748 domain-containing protein n=1 Tax=Ruficoccus amylovorans TaxID=1804625 RepID=A0A842HLH8_9BACT|nr:DUF748 domain-containing protein [Ruficoccus amylovorans]MBC2596376.1 DUF748 domain-containing protein [Ruficoccus amylovorans]